MLVIRYTDENERSLTRTSCVLYESVNRKRVDILSFELIPYTCWLRCPKQEDQRSAYTGTLIQYTLADCTQIFQQLGARTLGRRLFRATGIGTRAEGIYSLQ
jgi:hypothetical protein